MLWTNSLHSAKTWKTNIGKRASCKPMAGKLWKEKCKMRHRLSVRTSRDNRARRLGDVIGGYTTPNPQLCLPSPPLEWHFRLSFCVRCFIALLAFVSPTLNYVLLSLHCLVLQAWEVWGGLVENRELFIKKNWSNPVLSHMRATLQTRFARKTLLAG